MADVLKCLGDNKKVVREAVTKTLDAWVLVLQLDKLVSVQSSVQPPPWVVMS
jgi:cytoskeleton-associated protein 5